MPLISVVVRTKNEELWIQSCLTAIFSQEKVEVEVIIVDNESVDGTLDVVSKFPIYKLLHVEHFTPGRALNIGADAANGSYICFISSHCVPTDTLWLWKLLSGFKNRDVAAVYGRQLPTLETSSSDRRDLYNTFGVENRIQRLDPMFHNANSMVRKDIFENLRFDESVPHVEDRIWAKGILEKGYQIFYSAEATVFHYHGLNHGNNMIRSAGVASVLERYVYQPVTESALGIEQLFPTPDKVCFAILANWATDSEVESLMHSLAQDEFIASSDIFVCRDCPDQKNNSIRVPISFCLRDAIDLVVTELSETARVPKREYQYIVFFDPRYVYRRLGVVLDLVKKLALGGFACGFPAIVEYGSLWVEENNTLKSLNIGGGRRQDSKPYFRGLYGQGLVLKRIGSKFYTPWTSSNVCFEDLGSLEYAIRREVDL